MKRRFVKLMHWWPVERALLLACVIGLLALALMAAGVLMGTALVVVASMSLAQGLGVFAGALFALSVAAEAGVRHSQPPP